jgi:hypothetical protein
MRYRPACLLLVTLAAGCGRHAPPAGPAGERPYGPVTARVLALAREYDSRPGKPDPVGVEDFFGSFDVDQVGYDRAWRGQKIALRGARVWRVTLREGYAILFILNPNEPVKKPGEPFPENAVTMAACYFPAQIAGRRVMAAP